MAHAVGELGVLGRRAKCNRMMTKAKSNRPVRAATRAKERGSELLELAFVLPLLLTLLIGIFWIARAYNIYSTITRAAREGARVAVSPTCSTCGDAFPSSTAIQTAVTNSMAASGLATSGTGISISVQQHQQLNLDPNNPDAVWTVVTVTYPFKFVLPFTSLNGATVSMTTTSQMVEEP
jgi:Flp pilus assembly protein TadG